MKVVDPRTKLPLVSLKRLGPLMDTSRLYDHNGVPRLFHASAACYLSPRDNEVVLVAILVTEVELLLVRCDTCAVLWWSSIASVVRVITTPTAQYIGFISAHGQQRSALVHPLTSTDVAALVHVLTVLRQGSVKSTRSAYLLSMTVSDEDVRSVVEKEGGALKDTCDEPDSSPTFPIPSVPFHIANTLVQLDSHNNCELECTQLAQQCRDQGESHASVCADSIEALKQQQHDYEGKLMEERSRDKIIAAREGELSIIAEQRTKRRSDFEDMQQRHLMEKSKWQNVLQTRSHDEVSIKQKMFCQSKRHGDHVDRLRTELDEEQARINHTISYITARAGSMYDDIEDRARCLQSDLDQLLHDKLPTAESSRCKRLRNVQQEASDALAEHRALLKLVGELERAVARHAARIDDNMQRAKAVEVRAHESFDATLVDEVRHKSMVKTARANVAEIALLEQCISDMTQELEFILPDRNLLIVSEYDRKEVEEMNKRARAKRHNQNPLDGLLSEQRRHLNE